MILTSELAVADLEQYLHSLGFRISKAARKVFVQAEELAEKGDTFLFPQHFLLSLLQNVPQFQKTVNSLGGDFDKAINVVMDEIRQLKFDSYGSDDDLYSSDRNVTNSRGGLIDLCLAIAQKNMRSEIFDVDILPALFKYYDEISPAHWNLDRHDEHLQTPYNTLAHLVSVYDPHLFIKFSDILEQLNLTVAFRSPIENAPAEIRASLLRLLQDHPDYNTNCFIIMSFSNTRFHNEIAQAIKLALSKAGINALRADERSYSDDLLGNVRTYIYGCRFAIAVFERLQGEAFNPNVAFEVGHLYGLGKPVCLLKERTLPNLHSDIIGRLYVEFDVQDIERTVPQAVEKWLKDNMIVSNF